MGRPRNAQRAERPDLSAAKAEAAEDGFLPPSQERPDPGETRRHLERLDFEIRASFDPARELSIGFVVGHGRIVVHQSY